MRIQRRTRRILIRVEIRAAVDDLRKNQPETNKLRIHQKIKPEA